MAFQKTVSKVRTRTRDPAFDALRISGEFRVTIDETVEVGAAICVIDTEGVASGLSVDAAAPAPAVVQQPAPAVTLTAPPAPAPVPVPVKVPVPSAVGDSFLSGLWQRPFSSTQ